MGNSICKLTTIHIIFHTSSPFANLINDCISNLLLENLQHPILYMFCYMYVSRTL